MAQRIFKNAYTEKLKAGLLTNRGLDKYLSGNFHHPESEMLFKGDLAEISATSRSFVDPQLQKPHDFENAKVFYEELKSMTRTQATDHRLWVYLCHVPFMDYLRKRRPVEKQPEARRVQYVLDHWFLDNSGPSALKTNDLFLFWWGPHLTYDKDRADPFELTKELFSMLDYTRHLLSGYQGRSRDFTHAVLEFVIEHPDLFSRNKEAKVRFVMRKLNLIAGYRIIATLTKQEIKALIETYIGEISTTIAPVGIRRTETPQSETEA